jgi:hypothetical protein
MEKNSTAQAGDAFARAVLGPCIEWAYGRFKGGYGQFRYQGKPILAHRLAYCDFHGLSLDDITNVVIRHRCDNRICFNPLHLEPGTQTDNMRDMNARGRQVTPRGERNPNSKFTPEKVLAIRATYADGGHGSTMRELALQHDVDYKSIWCIVKRKSWTHI